jgi:MFS family permease
MKPPAALRRSDFRRLAIGQSVSALGDWMGTIALMALVAEISGSPTAVGAILAMRLLPSLFAGPLAAAAVKRFDRRRTMLAMDIVRAGAVTLIPFVRALWWIYSLAFFVELCGLIFLPARDALIPDLVADRDLPAANGIILVSSYGNIPLGAAVFAGISAAARAVGGHGALRFFAVFVLDAVTFLVSYEMIRRIGVSGAARRGAVPEESPLASFRRAVRLPLLHAVLPPLTTVAMGIGAMFSLGVIYVQQVLHAGNAGFGVLIAIFGAGAAVGVAWMRVRGGDGVSVALIRTSLIAMGVLLAVLSLVSSFGVALVVAAPFGAASAGALVGSITFLQERLDKKDRFLGLTGFHVVFRIGLSFAAIAAGVIVEHVHRLHAPLFGRIEPASTVMSAAGLVIVVGSLAIRRSKVRAATRRRSTRRARAHE